VIGATAKLITKYVFPTISTSPRFEGFVDEYSDETVIVDSYASGYPLLNPQFDFDPKNFVYNLNYVSQADKESLMSFYNLRKADIVYWHNEQDDNYYYVIFMRKPHCRPDGQKDRWAIDFEFRQVLEA